MKQFTIFLLCSVLSVQCSLAQEYADFEINGTNQGTGTFANAALPNFTWMATGTINGETQILNDETFDDGNAFENTFGQANNAENLRIQIYPNGLGTAGGPILSTSSLTLNFEDITPSALWGFCVVDIDVENCRISAIDENENEVTVEDIDDWLIELFDADLTTNGTNIPKWDPAHAALLGADTPEEYVVYNNLVIGGLNDSEAAAAFFMPDIPLKSLTIDYENLQEVYFTSYHFYIASLFATGIAEKSGIDFSLYPNPCMGKFQITSPKFQTNSNYQKINVQIIDLFGRLVEVFDMEHGTWNTEHDISHLPSGVYFVRVHAGHRIGVRKLVKQ